MNKYNECLKWINDSLANELILRISEEKKAKFELELFDLRNKVKSFLANEERNERKKKKTGIF